MKMNDDHLLELGTWFFLTAAGRSADPQRNSGYPRLEIWLPAQLKGLKG
jgi:hypothetical protein